MPGTYVMKDGRSPSPAATLQATSVIYLANDDATLDIKTIYPTCRAVDGPMAGILLFESRNAPSIATTISRAATRRTCSARSTCRAASSTSASGGGGSGGSGDRLQRRLDDHRRPTARRDGPTRSLTSTPQGDQRTAAGRPQPTSTYNATTN